MSYTQVMCWIQRNLGIDGMNFTKIKVFASVLLVLFGMGLAGYASVDLMTGGSSMTNSAGIVAACFLGFFVFHRKLTMNE